MEIMKRTAFRLRRFLAKCPGYFGLGRNRATWDRRRHDASYIPMASTELRDGKKQAHGFCFSGESGVSGAGWERHRRRSRLAC